MGIKLILSIGIAILFAAGAFWASQIAPTTQEGKGDDAEIKKLTSELGSEQFGVREDAMRRLAIIGLPAFDSLLQAEESIDPETSRRAKLVLRGIAAENHFTVVKGLKFEFIHDKEWKLPPPGEKTPVKVGLKVTNVSNPVVSICNNGLVHGVVRDGHNKQIGRMGIQIHTTGEFVSAHLKKYGSVITWFEGDLKTNAEGRLFLGCEDRFSRICIFEGLSKGKNRVSLVYYGDENLCGRTNGVWLGEAETAVDTILIE